MQHNANLLSSVAIKSLTGKALQPRKIQNNNRNKQDRLANQITAYYRNLNNQARNSSQKLHKVVIRGTTLGRDSVTKSNNSSVERKSTQEDRQNTIDA